jgi:hypothetical protein
VHLTLLGMPLAQAQTASAKLLIAGGTATDLRGVRSGAYSLAPSVLLAPSPSLALSFGGRGTRFSGGEWSLGGNGALAVRGALGGGFALRLDGDGEAIRASYRATYLLAEAIPALEWRYSAVTLWAGARAATARTSFAAGSLPPALSPGGAQTASQAGPAFGGALRFTSLERRWDARLSYREEHGRPGGVTVVDRTAGLSLSRGALGLAASIGKRSAEAESRLFGGARISVGLTPALALVGAAESYPSNRLTGTVGGRAFTAGLSLALGGAHSPRALPKPAGVPQLRPAYTRLSLAAPEARQVEVAGDWNEWRPVPLTRSSNGVWYVDLAIPAGSYRYGFRVDGTTWTIPKGVAAVNDGFGGKSAWLSVPETGRTASQSANRKEAP